MQCLTTRQSTIYVHLDSIVMDQEVSLFLGDGMSRHKLAGFFNIVINRNLHEFNHFVGQHLDKAGNFAIGESTQDKLSKDLLISQILSTTTSTFSVNEDSSQFKELQNSMLKKKEDIKETYRNIIQESSLERVSQFFLHLSQMNSQWIKENVEHVFASNERRFGSLLSMAKFSGTKRIDDYIYNTVIFLSSFNIISL